MEVKGKVLSIGKTEQISEKFKKRELIVEYAENPTYPEYLKFEAIQDKCDLLDDLSVGAEVEVFFNLKGRPYTNKEGITTYFNSLVIWRVNVLTSTPISTPQTTTIDESEEPDFPF